MNESIIDGLFYGGIAAFSRRAIPCAERVRINKKIEDEQRYFVSKMSLDDCQRFEALSNLYSQANSFEERDSFAYGLRIGTMLMCEVLLSSDGPDEQG